MFTLVIGVLVTILGAANRPSRLGGILAGLGSAVAGLIVFNILSGMDLDAATDGVLFGAPAPGSGLFMAGLGAFLGFIAGMGSISEAKRT